MIHLLIYSFVCFIVCFYIGLFSSASLGWGLLWQKSEKVNNVTSVSPVVDSDSSWGIPS